LKTLAQYISIHLLAILALTFTAGIACSPFLSQFYNFSTTFTVATALLSGVALILFLRHREKSVLLLLPFMALATGYFHGLSSLQPPSVNQHIYQQINRPIEAVITGYVDEMVTFDGKMSKIIITLYSLQKKDMQFQKPANGKVRLSFQGRWPDTILPGDLVIVRADLKRPRSFQTPGVFDYARFLAQKDIWITGFIRSPLYIDRLSDNATTLHHVTYWPERLRTHIGNYLDHNLSKKFSSIYRALLLGDRSRVSRSNLELFKASGTFHILAISGLHLAVIATLLYIICYWLLSRSETLLLRFSVRKIVAVLIIPILIGYALLAGLNSPVTRAVIMSTIVLIALCTNRMKSPAPLVGAAAIIILIFDPQQLFTVSFQLSFAAILGILFIFPILQKLLPETLHPSYKQTSTRHKAYRYLSSAFLVSLAATLTTSPFSIAAFNRISTIGPLANLIIEPLICLWCLPAGILALPFMWFSPSIANFFLSFGTLGINISLKIAEFITQWPWVSMYLPSPPLRHNILYFLVLYSFVILAVNHAKYKKKVLLCSCILLFSVFILDLLRPTENNRLPVITFIDVGQGSATVIETSTAVTLIDSGGSSWSDISVGESVVAPFLWSKGIYRIDNIVVTHPDADHYNGIRYIIEHFSPSHLWLRDVHGHDRHYKSLVRFARQRGVTIQIPDYGDLLENHEMNLECLANLKEDPKLNNQRNKTSNSSLILKACFKDTCFLFPGDINTSMEQSLLNKEINLQATVLLGAHHGSKTSNSTEFLDAVKPEYAIVSAAASNKGYFPHKSFLHNCKERNISVLSTAQNGTIEFTIKSNNLSIRTAQKLSNNPLYPLVLKPLSSHKQLTAAVIGKM
jgi:competence protein ComEC